MITTDMYKSYLSSRGSNLAEIKRHQSNQIMDATFTTDATYKKVYILTKDGWKYEDAKYQHHTAHSILRDSVDYYLQFRPHVHYPIGSYVFVPDDTDVKINLSEEELVNPFHLPDEKITQLWMIVGRDNANAFVRYNILQCNWNFKWIYNGEIYKCWGAVRNANSYTSGKWSDEYSSSLDNLVGAWLPDIYYIYKDHLSDLGLYDNRTIFYEQRFMLTNNKIEPKVYQVTKVIDLTPKGIIKLSIKQDELNITRDNVDLLICDYYSESGETKLNHNIIHPPENEEEKSSINSMYINDFGELENSESLNLSISLGKTFYYNVSFSNQNISPEWKITLINTENINQESIDYYENLIKMENIDKNIISIRPGKASSLIGKKYLLSVNDIFGNYYSSIELEIIK